MKAIYFFLAIVLVFPGVALAKDANEKPEKYHNDMYGLGWTIGTSTVAYFGTYQFVPPLARVIGAPILGASAGLLYDGCYNQDPRPFWERAIWDLAAAPVIPLIGYFIVERNQVAHNRRRGFTMNYNPFNRRATAVAWVRFW